MSFTSWLRNLRSVLGQRNPRRRGSLRAATQRPRLEVLEDRCVPAFLAPVDYAAGAVPYALVAADFNNDNVQDLAVANNGDSTVSVLLGNADGTFQPALNSATGNYPTSLLVGDFNGDGTPDLATGNDDNDGNYVIPGDVDISVLLGIEDANGNGTGTFAPPTNFVLNHPDGYPLPAASVSSVVVGDFNGDGLSDLGATADDYLGWPYETDIGAAFVFLGNGDGSFSAARESISIWNGSVRSGVVA
jgi:hypothetical protein